MSEMYIKGKWKVKEKKVSKINTPMIGIVYSALFKGKEVFGVLERVGGIEAYIRIKDNKLILVDIKSLKLIAA